MKGEGGSEARTAFQYSGVVAVGTRYLALNQEAVGSTPTPGTCLSQTEAIRLDEEPVLKTGSGAAACEFESHGLRLVRLGSSDASIVAFRSAKVRPSAGAKSDITRTQSRGLAAKAALSHGEDRRCESVRDYSTKRTAQVRQLAERLGLNPSVCGFDSRLGHS